LISFQHWFRSIIELLEATRLVSTSLAVVPTPTIMLLTFRLSTGQASPRTDDTIDMGFYSFSAATTQQDESIPCVAVTDPHLEHVVVDEEGSSIVLNEAPNLRMPSIRPLVTG
jgi:hypothetical protein